MKKQIIMLAIGASAMLLSVGCCMTSDDCGHKHDDGKKCCGSQACKEKKQCTMNDATAEKKCCGSQACKEKKQCTMNDATAEKKCCGSQACKEKAATK